MKTYHVVEHEDERAARVVGVCLLLAVAVLWAATAFGQTVVVNPTKVEFTVSADHNLSVAGTPVVTRYELRLFAPGATAPLTTADLGKPTAANDATVTFDRAAVFVALPMGEYTARVAAIGPGGEGVSDPPVPFGRLSAASAARAVVLR